ncbi:MAG: tyrosine--tRNA ligase [Neisseriales bacterium]|nr:MAG: tyrosine--tRNA ligase [Neisseriales bacterium]
MSAANQAILDLQARGLIAQVAEPAMLHARLAKESVTLYCGFDPTADSLHVGHLVPILTLKRFQDAGHRPIILVGGATGMIGDPSFKAAERPLKTLEEIEIAGKKIGEQLARFLSLEGTNAAILENNTHWFANMNILTFLREIGKYFSINAMISKDFVKERIDRADVGISFTEFSYSLLQAFDFVALNRRYGCTLQIGGSDQWGNITVGINLVRRLEKQSVDGLTLPLITKSDGTKFGKTEGGTVWLDANKTSPYQFYQFWLRVDDTDVDRFLKYFTFLSLDEINSIVSSSKKGIGQRRLAEEMTRLIHGEAGLSSAQRITHFVFAPDQEDTHITQGDEQQLLSDPLLHYWMKEERLLVNLIADSGLATSKSQARQLIKEGAVKVNHQTVMDIEYVIKEADLTFHQHALLTCGKKKLVFLSLTDLSASF